MDDVEFIRRIKRYIGGGLVFALLSSALFLYKARLFDFNQPIASNLFSDYGAFIAGTVGVLFSLITILFVIQNIRDQDKNFRAQDLNFTKQQIENRFFELLKIQRDNSELVSIECIDGSRRGRKVFIYLLDEFYVCYERVSQLRGYRDLGEQERVNLAYLAFFYGTDGESSRGVLKRRFSIMNGYDDAFIREYFEVFRSIPTVTKKSDFPYRIFQGHQSRLGHYFRHYFQTVNYINSDEILNEDEKYAYIKTLRAQFSTHEQVIFFLNSLSDLGLRWELIQSDPNKRLISKFNLIKNIPDGFVKYIDPKHYYPRVSYEGAIQGDRNRR